MSKTLIYTCMTCRGVTKTRDSIIVRMKPIETTEQCETCGGATPHLVTIKEEA